MASCITVWSDYTLARLEFSLHFPDLKPPPPITRFADASEQALRAQWNHVELEVESARAYVKVIEARNLAGEDAAFSWLRRSTKELDQYLRAVRWVLTVTERGTA